MENITQALADEEKAFETNPVIQRLLAFDQAAWSDFLSEEFALLAEEAEREDPNQRNDDLSLQTVVQTEMNEQMLGSDGQAECCICLQSISLGTSVTILECGHWFHSDGILRWLSGHRTCPVCRRSVG